MDVKRLKAIMVGHAVGDALGVPVEFSSKEALDADPVVDMREFGTFGVPKGTWSDDTSMSLCALEAMDGEKINIDRIMGNPRRSEQGCDPKGHRRSRGVLYRKRRRQRRLRAGII